VKKLESTDSQPEPERREESTPPEPSQTNDPNEGGKQQSSVDPPENIAGARPAPEVAESKSDGGQANAVPGLPGTHDVPPALAADPPATERQQVVSFGAGPTRQPPALRDCVRLLPEAVLNALHVGRDQHDEPFLQLYGRSVVHPLRDPGTRVILAQALIVEVGSVRPVELQGLIDELESYARLYGRRQHVWIGVAPNDEGGVDHDLVDDDQTIARVVPGRHYLITGGTTTLFYRTPRMLRRLWSKAGGDFYRLFRYLKHLRFQDQRLVGALVLYIMAHPKSPMTVFIHLFLIGPQGSGKTLLAEMLMAIISRSSVGVQPLPRNAVDLAIAASQGPLCGFDNVRSMPQWLSDLFCLMATSGVVTGRTLYSNASQSVISLHCPAIVTSLHAVITEPDLADRCLQVNVPPLDAECRRDPAVLMHEFEQDLPTIYRGALELIAEIYQQLPLVEPINPQRVYRFSHWLAALERVEGAPPGGYQSFYRDSLGQVMLDSLHESSLNVAVLDFVEGLSERSWSGTATELLAVLNRATGRRSSSGGDWPVNEIALSRRLRASVAAFRTQGIDIRFSKGRVRLITITRVGGASHE
jgi:hypothetical protein